MSLRLSSAQRAQVCAHAHACLPEEACGLIGGQDDQARLVVAVTNRLHSPTRFEMDPQEQLHAFRAFAQAGMALLAIYHSHPHGPAIPSLSDMAGFHYPGVLSLILSPGDPDWSLHVFSIAGERFTEVYLGETEERG